MAASSSEAYAIMSIVRGIIQSIIKPLLDPIMGIIQSVAGAGIKAVLMGGARACIAALAVLMATRI